MTLKLAQPLVVASLLLLPANWALAGSAGAGAIADNQHLTGAGLRSAARDAANPHVPGATGRTIVIGNHSTIADDAEATEMQRTGEYEPSE